MKKISQKAGKVTQLICETTCNLKAISEEDPPRTVGKAVYIHNTKAQTPGWMATT